MKTIEAIDGETITIEWERGELIDDHGHSKYYAVSGIGSDGKDYIGDAEYCNGEFEEIVNVELA